MHPCIWPPRFPWNKGSHFPSNLLPFRGKSVVFSVASYFDQMYGRILKYWDSNSPKTSKDKVGVSSLTIFRGHYMTPTQTMHSLEGKSIPQNCHRCVLCLIRPPNGWHLMIPVFSGEKMFKKKTTGKPPPYPWVHYCSPQSPPSNLWKDKKPDFAGHITPYHPCMVYLPTFGWFVW